jgi:hypothetical protein
MLNPKTIEGFVRRPDGYWYQTTDGTLHSMCPNRGELMMSYLRRMSQDSDVSYMKEDTKYILSSIRYRIVYHINLFLEGINKLVKPKPKKQKIAQKE